MNLLKHLLILGLCFSGEVSAAKYQIDFDIILNQVRHTGGAPTDILKQPELGSATLVYESDGTFKDDISLRNWLSEFKNTRILDEQPVNHVEQVLTQTKLMTGIRTVFNAQTETLGLDLGFKGENLNLKGLGYENFFLSALQNRYEFISGVTKLGVGGLDIWEGTARVTGVSSVPLPAAFYLYASGLLALLARKKIAC